MTTVSHHFLRRTARIKAEKLNRSPLTRGHHYRVERVERGPWRWRVVEVRL